MSVLYAKAFARAERFLGRVIDYARNGTRLEPFPSSPSFPFRASEKKRAKRKGRDFVLSDLSKEVTLIRERLDELGGHL